MMSGAGGGCRMIAVAIRPSRTLTEPGTMLRAAFACHTGPKPASGTCAAAGPPEYRDGPEPDLSGVIIQPLGKRRSPATATSRIRLWLAYRWECRGRPLDGKSGG